MNTENNSEKKSELKFCVTCEFHRRRYNSTYETIHLCAHPSNIAPEPDLVTQQPIYYQTCGELRYEDGHICGYEGALWKPKKQHVYTESQGPGTTRKKLSVDDI